MNENFNCGSMLIILNTNMDTREKQEIIDD